MLMNIPPASESQLKILEELSQEQLIALETSFDGLVKMMSFGVKRDQVAGIAHQSHHLGWDHIIMEQLARDPDTLARAEAELRRRHPESLYFDIND